MLYKRLMAVDPSLTCSGWALFSVSEQRLLAVGKIKSIDSKHSLAERLRDLQEKINSLYQQFSLASEDVVICESETTMRDPRAAFKVERVRGIFEALARDRSAVVPGRLNPRTVQNEVMGLKGKQLRREIVKETAVQVTHRVYADQLGQLGFDATPENLKRHQDIVDAILVGSLGLVRIKSAETTSTDLETLF